jgi:hypothetical protein
VAGANAGIDDVGTHARAGPIEGVAGIQRPTALVDAIQTPGRIALCCISRDDSIFFYELNSEILAQPFSVLRRHLNGKAIQHVLVSAHEFASVR